MLNGTPEGPGSKHGAAEAPGLSTPRSRRVFRFGDFELRTETGELSKRGIRVKAQAKPIQILEALLEKPGQLITREELCRKLWPSGTFVDFENGLNTATNRLRAALNDSADAPRYIETLPRLGYRFICPVIEVLPNSEPVAFNVGVRGEESQATEISTVPPPAPISQIAPEPETPVAGTYRWGAVPLTVALGVALLALAALFFSYFGWRAIAAQQRPTFTQLTFRAGVIGSARFAPDVKKILYTARWAGSARQTYLLDLNHTRSQELQFAPGSLASVSGKGDVAFISRDPVSVDHPVRLSKVSVNGGIAQLIAEGPQAADWAPNGKQLAAVLEVGTESVIEFPVGNVIYSSNGWFNCVRVSPRGDRIAFLEHPVRDDDAGHVRVVDGEGRTQVVTDEWNSIDGLAWAPSGNEVWFTASKKGAARALYAVTGTSNVREIANTPSSLRLLDVSRTGRVLIAADEIRMSMRGAPAFGNAEKDLSSFDFSHADDISPDGNFVLFTEGGDAGGQHYSAYVLNQKSSKASRIGPGRGLAISPDAKKALTIDPQDRSSIALIDLGSQRTTRISGNGFTYQWARFLPSGTTLLVGGAYPGEALQICTQRLDGSKPIPVGGLPYMDYVAVSPNGLRIAGVSGNETALVFELADGAARQISSVICAIPIAWSVDSNDLYALTLRDAVYPVVKKNLFTGATELWKTIAPQDTAGLIGIGGLVIAPATGAYAYSTTFNLSRLYVVDGWS